MQSTHYGTKMEAPPPSIPKNQCKTWHPRVHTKLDYKNPTLNNFEHFKLQDVPNKGLGVVCMKTTNKRFTLVGQYPNCHTKCFSHTNMGLDIDTKYKVGLGDWTAVDPKLKDGTFPRSSNLDKYLACRINEPNVDQSCEGKRFHPNCGWREGECLKTKEVWQEFWTYRKIYQGEELTIDYGTGYRRTYKHDSFESGIVLKCRKELKKLGPNQVLKNTAKVTKKNKENGTTVLPAVYRKHGVMRGGIMQNLTFANLNYSGKPKYESSAEKRREKQVNPSYKNAWFATEPKIKKHAFLKRPKWNANTSTTCDSTTRRTGLGLGTSTSTHDRLFGP
jgi:hypothetical protein